MERVEKCEICHWWDRGGKGYDWGTCHVRPPVLIPRTKDISNGYDKFCTIVSDGADTAYPKTFSTSFCGGFCPTAGKEGD